MAARIARRGGRRRSRGAGRAARRGVPSWRGPLRGRRRGRRRGSSRCRRPRLRVPAGPAFRVENIRMAYVFYESGLSVNVMYTVDAPREAGGRVQALRRDGSPRGARLTIQIREAEVEAGRNHSRFLLQPQERVLTPVTKERCR